jgi:exonuclease SbcD
VEVENNDLKNTMKVLHTSDWHLGQVLHNYNRNMEQENFFCQLKSIVAEEKPDVMVVSGDIYHTSSPTVANQKMYTEGILSLHEAYQDMQIVIIAGNHDGRSRLEIDSSLWSHFKVTVIGNIQYQADGSPDYDRHIVKVTDKEGCDIGYIAAVPFDYPQNFPADEDTPREKRQKVFFGRLLSKVKTMNTKSLPVVLMAHLTITGSDMTGHDMSIGGIESTDVDDLGDSYNYLALGHIHCPQNIKGSHVVRYCGSPLPVSFDENYPHSVTMVEMEGLQEIKVRPIEILNPMPLLTLPEEPQPFEDALNSLSMLPNNKKGYFRLNVTMNDDYLPSDCNERIMAAIKNKAIRYCYINRNIVEGEKPTEQLKLSIDELQVKSPTEIAKQYFLEKYGLDMDDELESMMEDAMRKTKRNVL